MGPQLLIQMSGVPGSGKSTMAKSLASSPNINGVVIDHDVLRSFFLESNSFAESAKLAYNLQWVLTEEFLKQGKNVIIDSTCNYKETLESGTTLAQKYSCIYKFVECRVDDIQLLQQRLQNRVSMRSQRTGIHLAPADAVTTGASHENENHLAKFLHWMENPLRPESNAIIVYTTGNSEESLRRVLDHIFSPTSESKDTPSLESSTSDFNNSASSNSTS